MATFFMFGKYNNEAVKEISISRTDQAVTTVRELGGDVNGMYALLGGTAGCGGGHESVGGLDKTHRNFIQFVSGRQSGNV